MAPKTPQPIYLTDHPFSPDLPTRMPELSMDLQDIERAKELSDEVIGRWVQKLRIASGGDCDERDVQEEKGGAQVSKAGDLTTDLKVSKDEKDEKKGDGSRAIETEKERGGEDVKRYEDRSICDHCSDPAWKVVCVDKGLDIEQSIKERAESKDVAGQKDKGKGKGKEKENKSQINEARQSSTKESISDVSDLDLTSDQKVDAQKDEATATDAELTPRPKRLEFDAGAVPLIDSKPLIISMAHTTISPTTMLKTKTTSMTASSPTILPIALPSIPVRYIPIYETRVGGGVEHDEESGGVKVDGW